MTQQFNPSLNAFSWKFVFDALRGPNWNSKQSQKRVKMRALRYLFCCSLPSQKCQASTGKKRFPRENLNGFSCALLWINFMTFHPLFVSVAEDFSTRTQPYDEMWCEIQHLWLAKRAWDENSNLAKIFSIRMLVRAARKISRFIFAQTSARALHPLFPRFPRWQHCDTDETHQHRNNDDVWFSICYASAKWWPAARDNFDWIFFPHRLPARVRCMRCWF